jgi:hypothetical protein
MKDILEVIARSLVDDPAGVRVTEKAADRQVALELSVSPDDVGKIIGKRGRIAKAIRTVIKAVATREHKKVTVEIV